MPTLKKWSAQGLIAWPDLVTAANALEAAIKDGQLQVRGPRRGDQESASMGWKLTPSRSGRESGPSPVADESWARQMQATSESLLQSAQMIAQCADRIVQACQQRPHPQGNQSSSKMNDGGSHPHLLQAIEQLDATRRHLLSQWDAYRQALGAETSRSPAESAKGAGPDFLEWQRLQGRLTRMEQMLSQLIERADPSQ
jgi:hypothetical protein